MVAGKDWFPGAPGDFAEGDVIVGKGGAYPRDALRVDEVTKEFVYAYPLGGGFRLRLDRPAIRKYKFRKVTPEEQETRAYGTRFFGDFLPEGKSYAGWTWGDLWNGWSTPHFEEKEARRMLRDMARELKGYGQGFSWRYDAERDAFVTLSGEDEEEDVWEGEMSDTPDGRKKLYGIGAYSWTWNEQEPLEYGDAEDE